MSNSLSREQVVDLLYYLGASKVVNREGKSDIQFTCTVHGESNPSCGYNVDEHIFHCFSCHAKGGLEQLLIQSLPEEFKCNADVDRFIFHRYKVDLEKADLEKAKSIRRYGEVKELPSKKVVNVQPLSFIAPYKSGKETYKYFFDRGFTKQTMIDFKIGRDTKNKTVTVPIFNDKNELLGMIGRYIDPNRAKNERYKIYETPTGVVVYPQNKAKAIEDTIIIVEGLLDSLYMHQLGYTNTVAMLTNFLSYKQSIWIRRNCSKVIDMTDQDSMGDLATKSIQEKLGKYTIIKSIKHLYPEGKKDPQECTPEEIKEMFNNLSSKRVIKRIT